MSQEEAQYKARRKAAKRQERLARGDLKRRARQERRERRRFRKQFGR